MSTSRWRISVEEEGGRSGPNQRGGPISGITCALSQLTGLYDFSRVHMNGTACVLFNLITESAGMLIFVNGACGMFRRNAYYSWKVETD